MPEHYTKNTLECTVWCNPCGAMTQHRVDDGRRGPCLECIKKLDLKIVVERIRKGLELEQKEERERKNPKLFD
jgi:signal recognition particle subunit SEC65